MMNMMNTMMNGGMGFMMPGMFLGATLWILLLVVLTWALLTWLNRRWGRPQFMPNAAEPLSLYHRYEQGYQSSQPIPGSYREGDHSAQPKQQFDQPSLPYPQVQEMPPQF